MSHDLEKKRVSDPPRPAMRFLKNVHTGVVFPYSPRLAALRYMIKCDAYGNATFYSQDDPYVVQSEKITIFQQLSAMRAGSTTVMLEEFDPQKQEEQLQCVMYELEARGLPLRDGELVALKGNHLEVLSRPVMDGPSNFQYRLQQKIEAMAVQAHLEIKRMCDIARAKINPGRL